MSARETTSYLRRFAISVATSSVITAALPSDTPWSAFTSRTAIRLRFFSGVRLFAIGAEGARGAGVVAAGAATLSGAAPVVQGAPAVCCRGAGGAAAASSGATTKTVRASSNPPGGRMLGR